MRMHKNMAVLLHSVLKKKPPGFNPIQHDNWYEIWMYAMSNEPLTHGERISGQNGAQFLLNLGKQ